MGRMLGQLRCARCKHTFWPAEGESAAPIVSCPACAAAHVNADAMPSRAQTWAYASMCSAEVLRWLDAWWVGELSSSSGGLLTAKRVWTGYVDGFMCLAALHRHENGCDHHVLVAALPPRGRGPSGWSSGGLWVTRRNARPVAPESLVPEVVARARAEGGEPLHALEEVEHTTPLAQEPEPPADAAADARLESMPLRCEGCGAPSCVGDLVGAARCPFCGAVQPLTPELAHELALYQRRLRAAQVHAAVPWSLSGQRRPPLADPAQVAMDCVHCGAPNRHRAGAVGETCTSCGAPLIASRAALSKGLAAQAEGARRALSASAHTYASVTANYSDTNHGFGVAIGVFAAIATVIPIPVYLWFALESRHESPWVAVPVGLVILLAIVVGFAIVRARTKRKTRELRARWEPRFVALAEQLGAPAVGGVWELREWVTRWWNDRIGPGWLKSAAGRGVVSTQVAGFPVLLVLLVDGNPPSPFGQRVSPHVVALLGARLPRDVAHWVRQGDAARIRGELERAGFAVELRTGGLSLLASQPRLAATMDDPDQLAVMAPAVFALARLAHLLRATAP